MTPTRSVLITGASSGIGFELAKRFARDRHRLVLVASSSERLAEAGKALRDAAGASPALIVKDLSRPGAAAEIFAELRAQSIEIGILVNCAGFGASGFFAQTDAALERDMMQLNMVALTQITKLALPDMLRRRDGCILNVASTAAFQPGPRMAVYYATKAYVLSFSEALANELDGSGVTVTTLCPGPTRSRFGNRAGIEGANVFRWGVMSAEAVSAAGYEGLMKGRRLVIPGLRNRLLAASVRVSPRRLVTAITRWLNEESAQSASR